MLVLYSEHKTWKDNWDNLYFTWFRDWWLAAHSQLDSCLQAELQLQWLQKDCCRIWLLFLYTQVLGLFKMCSFSSSFKVCWGSLNEWCPASNTNHAWRCENEGSGIKLKQARLNCWHQIKDSTLKDISLEFFFGALDGFFSSFSKNCQQNGDISTSSLTFFLILGEHAAPIMKCLKHPCLCSDSI